MIQDELCGHTVLVTVEVSVEEMESARDAKDAALNFVDSAVTKYAMSGALAVGAPLSIGMITADKSAKAKSRPEQEPQLQAEIDVELSRQNHKASSERNMQVIGGWLTGVLFVLAFLLEVLR